MSESAFSSAHDGLIALADASNPVPIRLVSEAALDQTLGDDWLRSFAELHGFKAAAGAVLLVPACNGGLELVLCGLGKTAQPMSLRGLPGKLPAGDYRIVEPPPGLDARLTALAWAFGGYAFDRYKPDLKAKAATKPRLAVEPDLDLEAACGARPTRRPWRRDMVNTPANAMGPRQIESIARQIAHSHGAQIAVVEGDALVEAGYPAVHAVGRAAVAERAPRMIEIRWSGGDIDAPLVCIVGKGVVFDTGGLDIKPSAAMRDDEEGHGRRRPRPGARPHADGRRACRSAWPCCCRWSRTPSPATPCAPAT